MEGVFVEENARCGWFSEASAERWGSLIYSTPDGGAVEVTAIGKCTEPAPPGEFRGPVVGFLRQGRKGATASAAASMDVPVQAATEESAALAQVEHELMDAERRLIESQMALEDKVAEVETKRRTAQLAADEFVAANRAPVGAFRWNERYEPSSRRRGLQTFPAPPVTGVQAQRAELEDAQRRIADDLERLGTIKRMQEAEKDLTLGISPIERPPLYGELREYRATAPTFPTSSPYNNYPRRQAYQRQKPNADLAAQLGEREAMLSQYMPGIGDMLSPDAFAANYVEWLRNPVATEGTNPFFMVPGGRVPPSADPRPLP